MAQNIRAMIEAKNAKKASRLVMKDVNHDLIVALLAIPVYGIEARDEEILSVIINAGSSADITELMDRIRDEYDQKVKDRKVKKTKQGVVDTDGFTVLVPRP